MNLSPGDKVRILRDLTRGADDVFAMRTEGKWRPVYTPLTDKMVEMHLGGVVEIGSYALLPSNQRMTPCRWIAADFDGKKPGTEWERDVRRAVEFLVDTGAALFVNLSRSAQGAHIRVLFDGPVPAWIARRWMNAWLEEAGVLTVDPSDIFEDPLPRSFDRLIPPQDNLSGRLNDNGNRMPGNLVGSPLNAKCARRNGGTLPLDPEQVALGNFEPDGKHWEHAVAALERERWNADRLTAALHDAPGCPSLTEPKPMGQQSSPLRVINNEEGKLDYMLKFCEFAKHVSEPQNQTYQLWLALATQLRRFGEDGRSVFHQISSRHHSYSEAEAEKKWNNAQSMSPVRCDTLVGWGYRCPHLQGARCAGAKAPAYFTDHTFAEIL